MNDEQLRAAFERGLARGAPRPPLDDLAAERLRRVVDREGSEAERLHTIDSLLASAEGRQELDIVVAAARAAREARPVARRQWVWRVAAAVVLLALPVTWLFSRGEDDERVMRGGDSPLVLLAPVGAPPVAAGARFTWRGLPEVIRYTLVLVDSAGNEVFSGDTRDTTLVLPATVPLQPGATYQWWVQARTRLGASVTAAPERVTVAR